LNGSFGVKYGYQLQKRNELHDGAVAKALRFIV
jgi:hypothetical protein